MQNRQSDLSLGATHVVRQALALESPALDRPAAAALTDQAGLGQSMSVVQRGVGGQLEAICPFYSPQALVVAQRESRHENSELIHLLCFPFLLTALSGADAYAHELLNRAISEVHTSPLTLPIVCLLPRHHPHEAVLRQLAFRCEPEQEMCIDPLVLRVCGFPDASELIVWRLVEALHPTPAPYDALVAAANASGQFSGATVPCIEASREFWARRQMFSVHSAFPRLGEVFDAQAAGVDLQAVRRILVAPSSGGDFTSVLQQRCGLLEEFWACDIQERMHEVAAFRATHTSLDAICRALLDELDRFAAGKSESCPQLIAIIEQLAPAHLDEVDDFLTLLSQISQQLTGSVATPDWLFPIRALSLLAPSEETVTSPLHVFTWLAEIRAARHLPLPAIYDSDDDQNAIPLQSLVCDLRGACEELPSGHFDLALSWEATHMFSEDQLTTYLATLCRTLAPNGVLLVTALRTDSPHPPSELSRVQETLPPTGWQVQPQHARLDMGKGLYGTLSGYYHALQVTRAS